MPSETFALAIDRVGMGVSTVRPSILLDVFALAMDGVGVDHCLVTPVVSNMFLCFGPTDQACTASLPSRHKARQRAPLWIRPGLGLRAMEEGPHCDAYRGLRCQEKCGFATS